MKTNDIKKGTKIKQRLLGHIVTGIMSDNGKGTTRVVDVKGSEVGLYDEMGSVYCHDMLYVLVEDGEVEKWESIEHTPAQLKCKAMVEDFFG